MYEKNENGGVPMDREERIEREAFRITGELESIAIEARQKMMETGASSYTAMVMGLGHLVIEPALDLCDERYGELLDLLENSIIDLKQRREAYFVA